MSIDTFAVYKAAKQRIVDKTHDVKDEVIVALWDSTSKALTEHAEMTVAIDDCRKTVAQLTHQNDIMGSRLAARTSLPLAH